MQDAVIVSATRTAVGKAPGGALRTVRPDDMAAAVITEALRRAPGVDPAEISDVIIGIRMPKSVMAPHSAYCLRPCQISSTTSR